MQTAIRDTQTDAATAYAEAGWCQSPYRFTQADVATLNDAIAHICRQDRPEVVHEHDSNTVRAVHGCHRFDDVCARLVSHPALVEMAETLLLEPVYVYQFKVNMKRAREGAAWPWHQDFAFWNRDDGMVRPDAVNLAIFLDDVHDDNGPLQVIPGSHRLGLLDEPSRGAIPSRNWRRHVAADLEYTVADGTVQQLSAKAGVRTMTGPAGTCVAFHPSIVHSSSNNLSAHPRAVLLVTYNAVANAPTHPMRPEFLVDRDTTPVVRSAGGPL
ncbi:phytanoyl-CoA dioxygenase family protein [Streptomyces chartreusis]|uniref:phytanoyl-CoA dioxygenase family protein n=1 Tax=Streptomyces chartreusis TaxID=1969 RepID=UPI00367EEC35